MRDASTPLSMTVGRFKVQGSRFRVQSSGFLGMDVGSWKKGWKESRENRKETRIKSKDEG